MKQKMMMTLVAAFMSQAASVAPAEARGARGCQQTQVGHASWYGPGFHGRTTASGERFNQWATNTAAHKTLPFNSLVRVTDLGTGRHHVVRINDRGPFIRGRVIDMSRAAANQLGFQSRGSARVRLDVVRCGR